MVIYVGKVNLNTIQHVHGTRARGNVFTFLKELNWRSIN